MIYHHWRQFHKMSSPISLKKKSFKLLSLAFTMLWANSADDKLMIFLIFFFLQITIWNFMQIVSSVCKFWPDETICLKCQILPSRKNKKNITNCHLINFLPRVKFGLSALFVCVEVLRPSQPNGVMSSVVSLPNHTLTGQLSPLSG